MSDHHRLCAIDPHHTSPCYDKDGHRLPGVVQPIPGRPPASIKVGQLEVDIPAGPQPTTPGPLHAVVRGPGGLDVTVSGEQGIFGRVLSAIGEVLTFDAD